MPTRSKVRKRVATCPKPGCNWKDVVPDKHAARRAIEDHVAYKHSDD